MNDYFQQLLADMLDNGKALDALCNYDGPQGKSELLALLANMLRDELGWEIEPQNIALTNGSQSAFSLAWHEKRQTTTSGIESSVARFVRSDLGVYGRRLPASGEQTKLRRFRAPASFCLLKSICRSLYHAKQSVQLLLLPGTHPQACQ